MPSPGLRTAAGIEAASLGVLLANLLTVHRPELSALLGPVHGCAYLFVILFTALSARDVRLLAAVPGIGGLLVLRRMAREPAESTTT
jgi:hypothetical protein